jgi:hypothetical protein
MNPEMRASDADRDRVVDLLRAAMSDGRLTAAEFEERVGTALSSRTFGDLAAVTADLVPGPVPGPGLGSAPALGPAPAPAPGLGPGEGFRLGPGFGAVPAPVPVGEVSRIDQRGGSVRRTGRWVVPRRLELRPSWCDVTLDFTDAVIRHDTLLIDMRMRGGSLALVIGPGMLVDADSLTAHFTDIELSTNVGPEAPIILQVRLAGRVRYGWIGTRRTPPSE